MATASMRYSSSVIYGQRIESLLAFSNWSLQLSNSSYSLIILPMLRGKWVPKNCAPHRKSKQRSSAWKRNRYSLEYPKIHPKSTHKQTINHSEMTLLCSTSIFFTYDVNNKRRVTRIQKKEKVKPNLWTYRKTLEYPFYLHDLLFVLKTLDTQHRKKHSQGLG